jgi:hypothetical protein
LAVIVAGGSAYSRVVLPSMDELYKYADRLKATVARYDGAKEPAKK